MSEPYETGWLTLIGIGEDGLKGLCHASRKAMSDAQVIFGGERHLALAEVGDKGRPWTHPFSVEPVLAARGTLVVVLASGDPFWHGVGGTLAKHLKPQEWQCMPAPPCWSLASAKMGWRLETVFALGLHAAPFDQLVPLLTNGERLLCTLSGGKAAGELANWMVKRGFGESTMTIMEALGGPNERLRTTTADTFAIEEVIAPVMVALEAKGKLGLSRTPGRSEDLFAHEGQITKGPMRALTLSALAPRAREHLWDIGAGSGSVSIEWSLAAPGATVSAIEPRGDRRENILENTHRFGLQDRIDVIAGHAPAALINLPRPDAVFLGGGADDGLMKYLWDNLKVGTRLVVNAVTLKSQALLTNWHQAEGGHLSKIDIAASAPLGRMSTWEPARTQFQWSVTR